MAVKGLSSKDILQYISKLSCDKSSFQDISLICRDGIVRWNRFLLAANSDLIKFCLQDIGEPTDLLVDEDVVIILPDVTSATLGTMLQCSLDFAVRRDILSVNEQQVMTLLGFNLLQKHPNLLGSTSVALAEPPESSSASSVVAIMPPKTPTPIPSSPSNDAEVHNIMLNADNFDPATDSVFHDLPLQSQDLKPEFDSISMMSIDVAPNLPTSGPNEMNDPAPPSNAVSKEDERFKCCYCGKTFKRSLHLEQHVANHERTNKFICDLCGKIFYHKSYLKSHKLYHKDKALNMHCPQCNQVFKGKRALNNHIQERHNLIKCLQCNCEVPQSFLKNHLQKVHDAKIKPAEKFHCNICKKVFSSMRGMMVHKRSHEGMNGFVAPRKQTYSKCDLCKKLFACQSHLDEHMSKQHEEVECQVCGKFVKNLRNHQKNVHAPGYSTKKVLTICPAAKCNQEFSTFYAAKYHFMRVHRNIGKAKEVCSICNKSFYNLKRHENEVHAENRFECGLCGKFFPVKQSLERHLNHVHHPIKHACPFCQKSLIHLTDHLISAHKIPKDQAKELVEGTTGRAAARTDLQWTAFSQKLE